ncbi:hypothetical protein [Microbacterium esteraromaticum]|uniref:hypothetical protein n=1 Tax=Microbacterium esteraromaticum TaxID=57043 RepID=UPI00195B2FBC|nr:hypothetical protein [Microbacterium esteraromaticum]MBM7465632.1 hypothetical protein [Microbacterium esteraromaticum]
MAGDTLSRAIVEYLAKGRSAFPKADEAAVVALAGAEAADVLARVRAIVDEMMAIEVDWSVSTLAEGGRKAHAQMADRHPELSDDALAALYWAFTYNAR